MATARLCLQDKSNIRTAFKRTLQRSLNNKPFLIDKKDLFSFGIECLPQEVGEKYLWLHSNQPKLVQTHSWRPSIWLITPHPTEPKDVYRYDITCEGTLPLDPTECPDTHPKYSDLLAWAQWYTHQADEISKAQTYIHTLVEYCTTVGQIVRLLPPEVMQYVPDWLKTSLSEAVRKSRVPMGWRDHEINTQERQDQFMQTLALGAISLEKPDHDVSCNRQTLTKPK